MSKKKNNPESGEKVALGARQRIVETADRLFYECGTRAVGIDRIIAEAGVAKMTLYAHFAGKDELILEVLRYREQAFYQWFGTVMERHGEKTRDPVRAFFGALKEWFESPGYRGCAFMNAAVETADFAHPVSEFVRGQKQRFGEVLRGVLSKAMKKDVAWLVPAVALLVEGAVVTAVIQGSPKSADVAMEAAQKLINGAKGG